MKLTECSSRIIRVSAASAAPKAKTAPISDLLQLKGRVSQSKTGGVTTISGGDDGRVIWSGASFALGKGNSLQIQPLKSAKRQR